MQLFTDWPFSQIIPNHVTDLWPVKLISCQVFSQLFFVSTAHSYSLFRHVAAIYFKTILHFFFKWHIFFQFKCFLCHIVNKIWANSQISAFCFYADFTLTLLLYKPKPNPGPTTCCHQLFDITFK